MFLFKQRVRLFFKAPSTFLLFFFILILQHCFAQPRAVILKGKVTDGATGMGLFGVSVCGNDTSKAVTTLADGHYVLIIDSGKHNVSYKLSGFQTKVITVLKHRQGNNIYLDIILFPLSQKISTVFKKPALEDSVLTIPFFEELCSALYNSNRVLNSPFDMVKEGNIAPATDKNGAQLLKRLNGIVVGDIHANKGLQSLNIFGLGERYNQVLVNGIVMNSFGQDSRAYPLELLPAEVVEKVSVQKIANPSLPADFAGGSVEFKTKDFPVSNFYSVQVGAGFSDGTSGKVFFGDKRGGAEWLSFPGSIRNLPVDFPTTRSQSALNQKNPQEQVYLSRKLNNNIAPVDYGTSTPNSTVLLGFGKTIKFKQGEKLGIIAFLNHQKSELIDETTVQVAPDIVENLFPFPDQTKALIRSLSKDINYRYASYFGGVVNTSVSFGRNIISLKNFLGSQSINVLTRRSDLFKSGDDSLSHAGINYKTEHKNFLNTQLAGEHSLSGTGKLKMNWSASYAFYRQQNPDERNFLLRQDPADKNNFEIGLQSGADDITNNGRSWKDFTDHNFTGMVNIQVPFIIKNKVQTLAGGIYIQNKYRIFFSDLLLVKGTGYFPLHDLLSPDRYYPGGLSVENYFVRKDRNSGNSTINGNNRGNYTASSNTGASYISLESQLSKYLSVNWGLRAETNTQLVSSMQYEYFKSYKNPQIISLDENSRVIRFDFLPSVNLSYQASNTIRLYAAFFKTVNRPQLQELSSYRSYDASSFLVKRGNALLANSTIENYDAGMHWFPDAGTTISITGFYKKIDRPIEYIMSGYSRGDMQSTPNNTPPATIRGITAAFKTNLHFISSAKWPSYVSAFANGNLLRSKVSAGPVKSNETPRIADHTLSECPDYTVNAGLIVQPPSLPHVTILYNRSGDYLTAVGSGALYTLDNGKTVSAIPDYRVKGREQLDIQIAQQFFKSKILLIAGVNNLLDNPYILYQDLNGNEKYDEPLTLGSRGNKGGFYLSGTDNNVAYSQSQRTFYLKISYSFK